MCIRDRVYALGGNKEAARYSGINTKLLAFSVYVLSGLCAGICGFLMASRISSGNANSADGYEMTVISAAVIGGVSLSGGVGTMYGTMIGVLIVGVDVYKRQGRQCGSERDLLHSSLNRRICGSVSAWKAL